MIGRAASWAAALALAGPAAAQVLPEAAPLLLRQGTPVAVVTDAPLTSKRTRQGQRFGLTVSEEVRVEGMLVIPKGARAVGEIARVVPKGMVGKPGKIEVRVMFVEVAGQRIRLDGRARDKGESGAAPVLLATPLVGFSAAFFTGKNAVIPAGTRIDAFVYQDVPLVRASAP